VVSGRGETRGCFRRHNPFEGTAQSEEYQAIVQGLVRYKNQPETLQQEVADLIGRPKGEREEGEGEKSGGFLLQPVDLDSGLSTEEAFQRVPVGFEDDGDGTTGNKTWNASDLVWMYMHALLQRSARLPSMTARLASLHASGLKGLIEDLAEEDSSVVEKLQLLVSRAILSFWRHDFSRAVQTLEVFVDLDCLGPRKLWFCQFPRMMRVHCRHSPIESEKHGFDVYEFPTALACNSPLFWEILESTLLFRRAEETDTAASILDLLKRLGSAAYVRGQKHSDWAILERTYGAVLRRCAALGSSVLDADAKTQIVEMSETKHWAVIPRSLFLKEAAMGVA